MLVSGCGIPTYTHCLRVSLTHAIDHSRPVNTTHAGKVTVVNSPFLQYKPNVIVPITSVMFEECFVPAYTVDL